MKRNTTRFLPVLLMMLSPCFLCTACGGGGSDDDTVDDNRRNDDDWRNSGEDYYLHTIDWNGQSGIIEFTRSSD